MNTIEKEQAYIVHSYNRFPIALKEGKGALVWDETGKEYIDLAAGIAVNTFGYGDREWLKAVSDQAGKLQHTSNYFYNAPSSDLAELLCKKSGMERVFFSNSGTEANECAIKAARKYARDTYGESRYEIVSLVNSFHGRTYGALAATGQEQFHIDFAPMPSGFSYIPAGDLNALEAKLQEKKVAGIIFEPIQGESGVIPLDGNFVRGMAELAEKYDALLIADEVQTGNGRTGKYFAYMHWNIQPDIVTTAKGLAGGLPIGATLFGKKAKGVLTPGKQGSTFGGNPVACAGALSIVSRIDGKMMKGVEERAAFIVGKLNGAPGVRSVSGMGLMIGIETEKKAGDVVNECLENGVIVITAKDKIRLLPPLNIPYDLLEKALNVLLKAVKI